MSGYVNTVFSFSERDASLALDLLKDEDEIHITSVSEPEDGIISVSAEDVNFYGIQAEETFTLESVLYDARSHYPNSTGGNRLFQARRPSYIESREEIYNLDEYKKVSLDSIEEHLAKGTLKSFIRQIHDQYLPSLPEAIKHMESMLQIDAFLTNINALSHNLGTTEMYQLNGIIKCGLRWKMLTLDTLLRVDHPQIKSHILSTLAK